ncbi:nicotinic acid phosphoribosyltransferase [Oleiphilus messinensis]|uniref:Nicotinamide phosphoribosyltransferase n=1 Tax=Oleiphilus messinensis TaxID=141451 RepID=A0A1Y0IBJ2_9GAMM|nr:nicotinate phosphoribosyltransferase [Oleiphilus messinensis]ARU57851.1 nicotinic acid phosphoribosyltransferase [Oleiphilus messinensis]
MKTNIILNVDSYKTSHYKQYPDETTYVSSYIESRGGEYAETVFFGLQAFIKDYLCTPVTRDDIEEAASLLSAHGVPFNRDGWEYIVSQHHGKLPIEIRSVAEGLVVPTHNVLLQICNTDPNCAWLTSYMETALLRAIWYPTTVATVSRECKKVIQQYLQTTADDLSGLPFKLHDFGARGASSEETAALGGAAHLVNFQGTDTLSGILAAKRFYGEAMAGFSIPAAEHSTITCWGRARERDAYENMLNQFAQPGMTVAVVSDSYDLWHAIDNIWGDELRDKVIQSGGTLVIRPDSGDPVEVVCKTIQRLMNRFGYRVNGKGYRVLPDFIRVIQGDGVSLTMIEKILSALKHANISADNIAFGMGAELLQKVNRDTLKFAMKASATRVKAIWQDVYKDPVTDPGKRSKRGRLALIRDPAGTYQTIRLENLGTRTDLLETVYRNGDLMKTISFAQIRANATTENRHVFGDAA